MSPTAVFVADDGRFVATELARGPWDPGAAHGGAPAALLMRALEHLAASDGLLLSRVTYEFLRPVPLGELSVDATVIRAGRRVALFEASLTAGGGVEVARARALKVRPAQSSAPAAQGALAVAPGDGRPSDFNAPHRPMFAPDAIEIRFIAGGFNEPGAATAWLRLREPLIWGEAPSGLQRLAAAADFGNGISSSLPWDIYTFINPDLTIYVERAPVGEWIGLQSETRIGGGGIGISESVLYDERGRVGRATQALLVSARSSASPTSGETP
jgi:hypothetical protein